MKKITFTCILISGVYSLQAQTLQLKPNDFSNPMNQYFKPDLGIKPDTYSLLKPQLNPDQIMASNNTGVNSQSFFSKMPIVKIDGVDNMPVAKLDGYDNMPVLGYDAGKAKKMKQVQNY